MAVKLCPFCAEEIDIRAIKCKHCGSMLEAQTISEQSDSEAFRRKIVDEVELRNQVKRAYKIETIKDTGIKAVKIYLKILRAVGIAFLVIFILVFIIALASH